MDSIEFGKKCRPFNIQYRDLFGYVPCREDYSCSQEEFLEALFRKNPNRRRLQRNRRHYQQWLQGSGIIQCITFKQSTAFCRAFLFCPNAKILNILKKLCKNT